MIQAPKQRVCILGTLLFCILFPFPFSDLSSQNPKELGQDFRSQVSDGIIASRLRVSGQNDQRRLIKSENSVIPLRRLHKLVFDFDLSWSGTEEESKKLKGHQEFHLILKPKSGGSSIFNPNLENSGKEFLYKGVQITSTFDFAQPFYGRPQGGRIEYLVENSLAQSPLGTFVVSLYWQKSETETVLIGSAETIIQ